MSIDRSYKTMRNTVRIRRNRLSVNIEDILYDALIELCNKENMSASDVIRDCLLRELLRLQLISNASIRRLLGINVEENLDAFE